MKNFLKSRNLVIGIITLIIGVVAVVGIARVWAFQSTTVSGNIVSFVMNPEGKIDGAILDTGDQIKFGAQTGALVAAQTKIGDALSATGHAGSKGGYGRELRAESLQIGDQTVTVVNAKPGDRDGKPRPPKGERPRPPRDGKPEPRDEQMNERPAPPDAPNAENQPEAKLPPAPEKETAKTTSNVKFVLVGGKGEARGLILADGTQIDLPKETKDAGIAFSEATAISVEGEASKGQFGTFIRPTTLTIDNQTFSFNR